MNEINVDVAVIGAGTAGLAAYRAAVARGKRAVIIEAGPYGTTCARVGCMPSKLLIAAAEAAHAPSRYAEFGLRLNGQVRVDGEAVMARVKRERDRFVGFVLKGVETIPQQDRVEGRARFLGDHLLQVDEHTRIRFGQAVIATGSSPIVPAMLRDLGDRVIVNDDVFDWSDLPGSVAVFGPGVIGLELGQALHRLGVAVSMFGASGSLGPLSDPAVRARAARAFSAEFHLDTEAKVLSVTRMGQRVKILFLNADGAIAERYVDYVIAATGRAPNVRGLGLEHTSLALDRFGVPLFDRTSMRCGQSHIFIAGDANQDVPLLHEAADEGRIAGDNAASYPEVHTFGRRAPLAIVFSDPQIAIVGERFAQLHVGGFVTGEASFEDQGRSRVMLRNKGLLHVYADTQSGKFLGAEMFGPDAEHIGHLLAWALQSGLTVAQMLDMPFYHPVVQEGLRTALRDAQAKLGRAWSGAVKVAA
jgi:dihydrolipoamide dehydrogenase